MNGRRVSRAQAEMLLDFGGRPDASAVSGQLVDQQLDGAVAAHNLLQDVGVAYVADEVGTGKTLIAAGVLALLRHEDPTMRALVVAPRANLQDKWRRELTSFARHNVRFPDLRVRAIGDYPVRPARTPARLADVISTWAEEPDCDVVSRLSSFQLGHRQDAMAQRAEYVNSWRDRLAAPGRSKVGRVLDDAVRRRGGTDVKEAIAACANRLLPDIGVLVIDEAHNLKGGLDGGAARNRVLWTLLGHNPEFASRVPGYGPRVDRVLMLSATPMEDDTDQLWAQLQVLGVEDRVPGLDAEDEDERLSALHGFLFRRLTKMRVAGQTLTRNRYRQEWRAGGTRAPDEPLPLSDARAQLTFALVQKRVADALNTDGGGRHFQIGMLTSFESLAESTKSRAERQAADAEADEQQFDDAEQNRSASDEERRGIDADGVRRLVASHTAEFGHAPPHPKMDAVVDRLVEGARRGRKALVFTRRVASVDELVQRVNDRMDDDLAQRLRAELHGMGADVDRLIGRYRAAAEQAEDREDREDRDQAVSVDLSTGDTDLTEDQAPAREQDAELGDGSEVTEEVRGGRSLFGWLFRESHADGLLTGWWLRQRLEPANGGYVTLLRDNHVAAVLGCEPSEVMSRLGQEIPGVGDVRDAVDELAQRHLGPAARISTLARFRAAQIAGLQLLERHASGVVRQRAAIAVTVLSQAAPSGSRARRRRVRVADRLGEVTLATALRADPALCAEVWHETLPTSWSSEDEFRRREWRWLLLTAAVRLDFPAIDLWLCEVLRNGSLRASDGNLDAPALIDSFLTTLDRQRTAPGDDWSSYAALCALARDADLILEVNGVPPTSDTVPAWVGNRVPAVGMSGQVNATAVRQFRTPTYPLALVSTDLLQEGEDLHTFCDEVHHYGVAWMPSSLEQRTGRVDRVNSLAERRLSREGVELGADGRPAHDDRLHVLFPYVSGTYEELQVRRVLERLTLHVRLLHESFGRTVEASPRLDPNEALTSAVQPEPVEGNLGEPYAIRPEWLTARSRAFPVVDASVAEDAKRAFGALLQVTGWGPHPVEWLTRSPGTHLLGECRIGERYQPVDLRLSSLHGRPVVTIVSPVGLVSDDQLADLVGASGAVDGARVGVVQLGPRDRRSFSLTVEDVAFVPRSLDVLGALEPRVVRVLEQADTLEAELIGSDERLARFEADLREEARRD